MPPITHHCAFKDCDATTRDPKTFRSRPKDSPPGWCFEEGCGDLICRYHYDTAVLPDKRQKAADTEASAGMRQTRSAASRETPVALVQRAAPRTEVDALRMSDDGEGEEGEDPFDHVLGNLVRRKLPRFPPMYNANDDDDEGGEEEEEENGGGGGRMLDLSDLGEVCGRVQRAELYV